MKNETSAPVDVLAVMDESADCLGLDDRTAIEKSLRHARAVVAELIAATKNVTNVRHTFNAKDSLDGGQSCGLCGKNFRDTTFHFIVGESTNKDYARLRAALAACGVNS